MKIGLDDPKPENVWGSGEEDEKEGIDGGIVKGGVDLTGLERRKGH